MLITDIKVFPVWVGSRNQCLVKVETDRGIYGWGEAGVSWRELAVQGAVRHYREFLIGKDPMRTGAIWQEVYRSQYFEGGRVLVSALAAIDIALHDIKAKALGVPVYELLGGKQREYIPCFATTGATSAEQLISATKLLVEKGWECIRVMAVMPPGLPEGVYEPRASLALTADYMVELRRAVGSGPVLGVEFHHRLSVAEAASFCQRMPPGTLDFLEEPIRDESPEAYATLRGMISIPLAIGEEFSSKWAFLPFIERGLTDFARIDLCNVGGLTEGMKVAGWAEAHYIDMMPHNPLGPVCTAATVHFGAAVPNFSWMEIRVSPTENLSFYDRDIFPVQPEAEGAMIRVPDKPGLGVEVDEDLAAKQAFRFGEAPHWKRRDGSVTNW